jgi:pantetheine-phosphate adenylyltransferase
VTTAFLPGSFDPPTNGHVDVLRRAMKVFDRVVIGVVDNPNKSGLFSVAERVALLAAIAKDGADVVSFNGLVVRAAEKVGADVMVKGVRDTTDVAYETQFALMNRHLTGIETVLLPADPASSFVSSSLVKEIWKLGSDVSSLVPEQVLAALEGKEPS